MLGAYFVLYPKARITSLLFLGFFVQFLQVLGGVMGLLVAGDAGALRIGRTLAAPRRGTSRCGGCSDRRSRGRGALSVETVPLANPCSRPSTEPGL